MQGYGKTENGTNGELLETNVTVISIEDCIEQYKFNVSNKDDGERAIVKSELCADNNGIPDGLNDRFVCTKGIFGGDRRNSQGNTVISGACKGDSGSPLTLPSEEGRSTLIGLVSGGIACGDGFPSWYTSVSFYKDWISCIIEKSIQYDNNQKKVEEKCLRKASKRVIRTEDRIFPEGCGLEKAFSDIFS